ncbi:uncharacterized protein LOC110459411 [Mizuhopecten yessoensis]|uniref:uncharacterized protein LOC110459411 n=1 Tax=Mizuhopecten yessoensis TaxID=6573 RepID=UPI000B45D306|nr:uncharacterized protein LOC110459411 [Mizuhopecten yessoensis]
MAACKIWLAFTGFIKTLIAMASKLAICCAQVHVPNTCAWCESIQDVNWYCNDCQEALCERCFEGHQRARKTRNDVVVQITKATRQNGAVLPEVCTTHPGKSCDLYCTECHVVMCSMCFTQKHKQHTFKHLEEEVVSQKLYMHDQLKNLKSSLDGHVSTLTKRKRDSKSFKESAYVILQTVQTRLSHLMPDCILKNGDCRYEQRNINSKQVRQIGAYLIHVRQINSICPIDDTQVWTSASGSNELIKVNKNGKVTESVKLDFNPWCLTLTNTEELLITCCGGSPLIHKLSKDRQITRFTDISPLQAYGISVSDSDEVFVTTRTKTIQVLNMSGERIRQISFGMSLQAHAYGMLSIVCLTTGYIAVTIGNFGRYCKEMVVINITDQVIHNWSGRLDHGRTIEKTMQCDIARDRYDRVFVPDFITNQVYVISGNDRTAQCLLDDRHGLMGPTAVCVDRCGHVWVGCFDGSVYVMEL